MQICGELRRILGTLQVGEPLPSVPSLMRSLSVSQTTLDLAYAKLEAEGRIERLPNKGVFAADPLKSKGEIALVLSHCFLADNASPFYARMCARLRDDLHALNPRWAVKLHLGVSTVTGPEMPATLDLLEPAVLPRLRGVLSFTKLYALESKLTAAGIPVVYMGGTRAATGNGVGVVCWDVKKTFLDGMRHLAESGCASVCLLHPRYVGKAPEELFLAPVAAKAAAACGLRFRDEWIGYEEGGWSERQGYELFKRFWGQPARTDGVFVSDDVLCHGVLRAVQELHLRLPRDLRLLTRTTRGIGFPYPRPISRVEGDLVESSRLALRLLQTLAGAQPPAHPVEWVQVRLVKGETT
ncbi:MAG: substrate-binding domain-containing protein [Kiritimatiellae bacterium]|nr:substrate-binding domain-containing protein [Kiritimatiellia bacterium]